MQICDRCVTNPVIPFLSRDVSPCTVTSLYQVDDVTKVDLIVAPGSLDPLASPEIKELTMLATQVFTTSNFHRTIPYPFTTSSSQTPKDIPRKLSRLYTYIYTSTPCMISNNSSPPPKV